MSDGFKLSSFRLSSRLAKPVLSGVKVQLIALSENYRF
jgi:hypothetical protein